MLVRGDDLRTVSLSQLIHRGIIMLVKVMAKAFAIVSQRRQQSIIEGEISPAKNATKDP